MMQQEQGQGGQEQNGHHKPRTEVRSDVLELNTRRNRLENEIKEYQEILKSQGVTMDEPLVDAEGFPRSDIDIVQVRQARNKIICLNNDLRNIMKQIEDKLADYFVSE